MLIHTHTERERERERENFLSLPLSERFANTFNAGICKLADSIKPINVAVAPASSPIASLFSSGIDLISCFFKKWFLFLVTCIGHVGQYPGGIDLNRLVFVLQQFNQGW